MVVVVVVVVVMSRVVFVLAVFSLAIMVITKSYTDTRGIGQDALPIISIQKLSAPSPHVNHTHTRTHAHTVATFQLLFVTSLHIPHNYDHAVHELI